jgi:hypothetical protein
VPDEGVEDVVGTATAWPLLLNVAPASRQAARQVVPYAEVKQQKGTGRPRWCPKQTARASKTEAEDESAAAQLVHLLGRRGGSAVPRELALRRKYSY